VKNNINNLLKRRESEKMESESNGIAMELYSRMRAACIENHTGHSSRQASAWYAKLEFAASTADVAAAYVIWVSHVLRNGIQDDELDNAIGICLESRMKSRIQKDMEAKANDNF
jgi:hypothetical protein